MSIYQKATVVHTFPAYDLVTLAVDNNGLINLKAGDLISIGSKAQSNYQLGSVMSSAIADGECPLAAYEREMSIAGGETHYVMALGATISSYDEPKYQKIMVEFGQRINFEGRVFEIYAQCNNNVGLKFIEMKDYFKNQSVK